MRFFNKNITLLLICCSCLGSLYAQSDTLKIDGPNLKDLSEYVTYWVDSTQNGSLNNAVVQWQKGAYKKWAPNSTLNLGTNPYPLWWHLNVQNTDTETHDFWWSIYTQADSLYVFRLQDSLWRPTDTLVYKTHLDDKKTRTRFPVIPVHLKAGENQQLLVKIINRRHTQNAYTDLTTPAHNLLWEKRFYLKVGFFLGGFLLIAVVSLILHFFMKMRAFLYFSGYLLCVIILILHEELLITVAPDKWLFILIKDWHPLPLSLVALGFHYLAIVFLLNIKRHDNAWTKYSQHINLALLFFGAVVTILCAVFWENMTFENPMFLVLWNLCVVFVFLMLFNTLFIFVYLMYLKKRTLPGLILGFAMVYYNAAGYFLNYAGILSYYPITYPNYFYWIVSLEFLLLGVLLAWRYSKTQTQYIGLLKENAKNDEISHLRTLSVLEDERRLIAKNLHDDLGTTISAIKLIVSNNYASDVQLTKMVQRAGDEIRSFYKKIVGTGEELISLHEMIRIKVADAEKLSNIAIEFIQSGEAPHIEQPLKESILRICTELLSNLVKHSKSQTASLQLIYDEDQLQLLVEDDGVGFDVNKKTGTMGIHNIYSRAERWGGNVYISSNHKGTTCIVNIPLNRK